MNNLEKTKEELIFELQTLRNEYDDLKNTYQKDIAELKNAENELKQSVELFKTSSENMLEAFGIFSAIRDSSGKILDFKIEYVNHAAREISQMSSKQQIGKTILNPTCTLSSISPYKINNENF